MAHIFRYLNVQNAYAPAFSADDRHIVFLADISGVPQVWQVPAEDAQRPWWPDQLTFEQERVMGLWPAPHSNQILFARDVGGNEKAQLYLLDPETAGLETLTEGHEEAMHLFGCWTHDGDAIYFAANRRDPTHFDVFRHDLKRRETEMIWRHDEPGYLVHFSATRDGRRLAFVRNTASFDNDLLELNLASGDVRRLSPPDKQARYGPIAYTPGGRTLYLVTDLNSDFLHVRRLEPASRTWETVATPNWDVELMELYLPVASWPTPST